MSSRPLRTLASATSTLALVAAGIAVTTSPASAAVGQLCPTAYPLTKVEAGETVSNLTPGQPVTGLTTVRGTTPEEFHGTYIGTIKGGIGPGLDLPVFDMEGSRITDAGGKVDAGIWAGMSGSPVYDDATGSLIGAVSYGFSSTPSRRAGVTPATYMYDLTNPKYSLSAARSTVKATSREAAAMAKESDDKTPLGTGRLLKPSKQVAGATAARANAAAAKSRLLKEKAPSKSGGFLAGGSGNGTDIDYPIQPGGNIATTFSTGDVTTAAIGTVTAVCDDQVFAFGHPDEFSGKSSETFNGASAVDVQEEGAGGEGSYKLANVGKVKGVITQDRLAGILGTLGQAPTTADVITRATGLGDTREATTSVSVPAALPFVVYTQVTNDAIALLDQYSSGEALMTWTIKYTRSIRGVAKPQIFTRTQRYSAASSFPDRVSFDVASDVETILDNGFEDVTITSVDVNTKYQPDYRAYKINGIQYLSGGVWKNSSSTGKIRAKRGSTIKLRVKLTADRGSKVAPTTFQTSWKTSSSKKKSGAFTFYGQSYNYDEEEFFFDEDDYEDEDPIRNLSQLLALMKSTPRGDDVLARYRYQTNVGKLIKFKNVRAPGLVTGTRTVRLSYK